MAHDELIYSEHDDDMQTCMDNTTSIAENGNEHFTEFTIGQRNALKLLHNGYDYTRSVTTYRGIKWLCAKKNSTKCKARVRLNPDKSITVLNGLHNHARRSSKSSVVTIMNVNISDVQ